MTFIGQSARRVEDERFLTGRGLFVEDVNFPDQLFAYVVRSPHAHAEITRIDTSFATGATVFTYTDIADLGHLPCATAVATVGSMLVPPRPALANGRVRHVGDPVAFVVAETPAAARDAAERVIVDYRPLPSVVDAEIALAPGAPLLWDEVPGNLSFRFQKGDPDAVRAAMARAAHVVELKLINNRLIIAPTETRAAIGRFENDTFHLFVTAASVHAIRDQLANAVFRLPADRVLVSAPDVGGGFGIKNALYPEWVLLLHAARVLGRPVKWIEDRAEDFVSTAQGRDNITTARLGLDEAGTFLALDISTIANLGAYMSGGGPGSSTNAPANVMGSGYVIPAIAMDVRAAYTNTVPIDAYRGAGKPEANYLLERLIDLASRRHGFDPAELRQRNMITDFPYTKALGSVVDCGRFTESIDDAIMLADRTGFAARRALSEQRGKLRGLGLCCFMETARGAPNEGAEIRFTHDAAVELLVGTQSNGQGHETTYPQIAADLLGLPPETFRYIQADTEKVRAGNGHGGARSMHMGGAAMVRAAREVIAKGKEAAALLLQAKPDEIKFDSGNFTAGDRSIALLDVAREASLDTYVWNLLDIITFPNGCHIAEVEIDPDTGLVTLDRYFGVDDYGTLINPMLTLGQVHGGLAQGIGQAMLENTVYDPDSGQLLSGSLMDYALPKAADLPDLNITLSGTPTNANPLGVKGAGQAGAMASPQTIICAILDALEPLGVTQIDMPATPERVWRAIQSARKENSPVMTRIAAEEYLDALAAHGIDHLFVNPGTDFAPIVEAYARAARTNRPVPRPMVVPHENAAVGMAHGYTMVTGKPQAVMLHTNVGTANSINMLIDASRDRIPMLLTSGRTPFTESGAEGSRNVHIHWAQEMYDQAGMLREMVKWDYEMKRGDQAGHVVDRAMEMATTSPQGPVYLSLPREVLGETVGTAESNRAHRARPRAPEAASRDIDQLADWIAAARNPLIITGMLGRDKNDSVVLARLADRYALPVVPFNTRYFALSANHPMFQGSAPGPLLKDADLVIVFEADVPWIPSKETPAAGAKIVQIGEDPLHARLPMRGFPSDLTLTATSLSVLEALETALAGRATPHAEDRRTRLTARSAALHATWNEEAERAGKANTITLPWLNHCLREVVDADTIVISEYSFRQEYCPLDTPGGLFALSSAGGLGWGFPASLGAKLASPEKMVLSVLGDGAYMFANPTACHYVAQMQNLPVLTVIYNNALYGAVRRATLDMYGHGVASEGDGRLLANLPAPAFEKIVAAHDGHGEKVERPADLPAALRRAATAVRGGQQALVNVICP